MLTLAAGSVVETVMPDLTSLPLWIALVPLAIYLLVIATFHVRSCPTAVPGHWDLVLLALTVAGLGLGGPLALLQPAGVAGAWRWAVPLVTLALMVAVAMLASRPRLVIYNATGEHVRPVVAAVAAELDPGARWAGETVALPDRGVQVHLDAAGGMRTVSLVAVGSRASPEAWAEFSRRIRREVATLRVRASPWAAVFTALAAGVLALALWLAWRPFPADSSRPDSPAAVPAARPLPASLPLSEDVHADPRRPVGT